ncbi:MAG: hypothetical protein IT281_03350 [Ignavibacteria bacterium]|nr:hypothetical protein [Ignavibacteria bacterium]
MEKRTATISIPQCVAVDTLKKMEENKITCQYEGVDQSGRLLMKINYLSDQDGYLKKLIKEMNEGEQSMNLLLEICGAMFMNEIVKAKTAAFLEQIPKRNGNK